MKSGKAARSLIDIIIANTNSGYAITCTKLYIYRYGLFNFCGRLQLREAKS